MPINYSRSFQIRDTRNGSWFWVHTHIWRDKCLTHAEKVIYGTLASYSNVSQKSYPSINSVANDSGISPRHTYRCIKRLEKLKYLDIKRRHGKSNIYTLLKTTPDIMSPLTNIPHGGDKKTLRTISNTRNITLDNTKVIAGDTRQAHKEDKRNVLIEHILAEFKKIYGFKPTDKYPRRPAWNIIQRFTTFLKEIGRVPDEATMEKAISKYFKWVSNRDWAENVETLDVFRRKTDIFFSKVKESLEIQGGQGD